MSWYFPRVSSLLAGQKEGKAQPRGLILKPTVPPTARQAPHAQPFQALGFLLHSVEP